MTIARDALRPSADEGMTLIEVVVALLVFAIVAAGIVGGMVTISGLTADSRSRITATNLAAQEIDLVRAITDPFSIEDAKTDTPITGRTYTITRTVSWVSQSGVDITCSSATNLFYLRVSVQVTWTGRMATTRPVVADTLIAPSGRISDGASGAIGVSVVGADGLPMPGVAVSIVPTSGGAALKAQPPVTDDKGCTYVTQVAPGTYDVSIAKSGYIDDGQDSTPHASVVVTVGATQSVSFQFDAAGTFPVVYGTAYSGAVQYPTDLKTTFISTSGMYVTSTMAATVKLHPYSSGYTAVAGVLGTAAGKTTCAAVDPAAWKAGTSNGVSLKDGARGPVATAKPGGTADRDLTVTLGVVTVKAPKGTYLTAVNTTPTGSGNPGCDSGSTYTFGKVGSTGTAALALPFGSWLIYSGSSAGSTTTQLPGSDLAAVTDAAGGDVTGSGIVTLDPRTK